MKGLKLVLNATAYAIPSVKIPELKAGIEFKNANTNIKFLTNVRSLLNEFTLSYLARDNFLFGANFILDPRTKTLEKYDFGVNWAPATNTVVGLKHESISKDAL